MLKQKTLAPISVLFDQGYKLSHFCEGLSKYVQNQLKSAQTDYKVFRTLNKWFKKNIFHIEMFIPFCPECFSKYVIKNGVKERKLYFYDKGLVKTEIQAYKCKKCGKKFNTDISEIVEENSNFKNDFKNKCLELVGLFFGDQCVMLLIKLKKTQESIFHNNTIENWILEYKNPNKDDSNRYSGYYLFDVEWIKINGVWNHRFTLYDSKQNIIVADEIYSKENSENLREFLEQNTMNKEKITIISDLDENI